MKKLEFTPTLSFGTIVQIVIVIVGCAVAWGLLQAKVEHSKETFDYRVFQITSELKNYILEADALAARIRILENQSARSDERFTLILTMITEIKDQVGELSKLTRKLE